MGGRVMSTIKAVWSQKACRATLLASTSFLAARRVGIPREVTMRVI
jgi:hypothetical protein